MKLLKIWLNVYIKVTNMETSQTTKNAYPSWNDVAINFWKSFDEIYSYVFRHVVPRLRIVVKLIAPEGRLMQAQSACQAEKR